MDCTCVISVMFCKKLKKRKRKKDTLALKEGKYVVYVFFDRRNSNSRVDTPFSITMLTLVEFKL